MLVPLRVTTLMKPPRARPTFGGATPGTSRAESRKFRPLSGTLLNLRTGARCLAISLRALSMTGTSAGDLHGRIEAGHLQRHRQLERRRHGHRGERPHLASAKPARPMQDFVGADPKIQKPEAARVIGLALGRLVGVEVARHDARRRHHGALRVHHAPAHAAGACPKPSPRPSFRTGGTGGPMRLPPVRPRAPRGRAGARPLLTR